MPQATMPGPSLLQYGVSQFERHMLGQLAEVPGREAPAAQVMVSVNVMVAH
jgi:hypothetical protein